MIERLIDRLQFRPAQLLIYLVAICAGLSLFHLQLPMAATVLLGLVLVTAIIIEPLVGLSVAIVIGPLGAIENAILHTGSVDSAQIVLVLTAGSWIAHRILRRQVEWPRGIVAISISYAAFLLVSIISLLVAVDLAAALKEIAKWLQIGLVAVMIALPGRDYSRDKVVKWIAAALIVSALVQSAVGIWQFGIRGDGPEHFSILSQYFRAYGTFEQPNPYAGFLGLVLPLIVGLGIGTVATWTSRKQQISIIYLAGLVIAAFVVSCAVIMSWSRGAWLGLAAAFTVMLLFLPRKKVVGLVILSLVILMGIIAINSGLMPASIEQRMLGFTEYFQFEDVRGAHITPDRFAVLERMAHWQAALSMANESPWIGVGTGNYAAAYPDHALMQWPYALGHAHNLYLNLLAETGVLGLISYLGFWAVALVLIMRLISTSEGVPRGIALGLLGAVTHLSVHNLVDKLYVNNVYLHIGSLIGILVVLISSSRSNVAHN